jgi:hypothetical protein
MTSSIAHLAECTTPVQTARVLNPISPDYYLADEVKTAEQARPETDAAVKVTLSQAAQSVLKG